MLPRTVIAAVALAAAVLPAAPAVAAGPRVVAVTTPASGAAGNDDAPAISADRRFVAFTTGDPDCRSGGSTSDCRVHRRDLTTGAVVLVSAGLTGDSVGPSISADGRFVAFTALGGVYRRDVRTATTVLVAAGASGASISGDGSRVAYVSGDDVLVRDLTTGVTRTATPGTGFGPSYQPALSADGRFVAFTSDRENLVAGDTNGGPDVFVTEVARGRVSMVSVNSAGVQAPDANWGVDGPAISANGRFVAFPSYGSTLVAGDTNEAADVFVHDRRTGTTDRVSVATGGAQLTGGGSFQVTISGSGRHVGFRSDAADAVPGDTNGWSDVFVRDRTAGTTTRVSVAATGTQADGPSRRPSISADGRGVAFLTGAANLAPGGTAGADDIVARIPG